MALEGPAPPVGSRKSLSTALRDAAVLRRCIIVTKMYWGIWLVRCVFLPRSRQQNLTEGTRVGLLSNWGYRVMDDLNDDSLEVAVAFFEVERMESRRGPPGACT